MSILIELIHENMKIKSVLAVLLMLAFHTTHAQKNTVVNQPDQVAISLDNVAFDEESYMRVLSSDNEVIAYYTRFENQSGAVKSMRVFDVEKNLTYALVPLITDRGFEIHIRDSNERRGLLNLTASINGLRVNYHTEVDYFDKPYSFSYSTRIGIGKVNINETVHYQGRDVLSNRTKLSALSGVDLSPIVADKAFYEANKLDVANWVLIIELLKELSTETSKYNNSNNFRE